MAKGDIPRNARCPCGSGKKYKHCCLGRSTVKGQRKLLTIPVLIAVASIIGAVVVWQLSSLNSGLATGAGGLLLAGIFAVVRDPPPPGRGRGGASDINFGA